MRSRFCVIDGEMDRFIQIIDGFYADPDALRRKAMQMRFAEPDGYVGWRTRAYHPRGIKQRIEEKFGVTITCWEKDLNAIETCNGVFFKALSGGRHAETVGVHYDEPIDWMMLIIYMTPRAPYDTGTSLWQHRETGLIAAPTRMDARRLGLSVKMLNQILERDCRKAKRWREIDRIGNLYNRAVMIPAGVLHSATSHFGSSVSNGRLYQTFHFSAQRSRP